MATLSTKTISDLRLHTFLHQMIKVVNKSQKLVEAECEMIRSLLKPWPIKKKIIEAPSETTNQIYNGQKADVLSTEEQQALSQAEQILSKARKALGTTINLKDPIKTSEQDTVSNKDVQYDQTVKETFSEPLQKTQQKDHITHNNDRLEEKKSFVNSSCEQLKKEKSIHSAASKKSGTSAEVLLKKESQRTSRPLSQGSNLNSKPQVVNKGYIAAHLLAPFKTDPNIKVPKHSKYRTLSKEIQTSKSASKKTIQSSKVLPGIAQSKISSQDSESKRLAPNANNNASSGSIDLESSEVIVKRNLLPSNRNVSKPVANSIVQESQSNVIQSQEESLQSKLAFTLQENGTSLKLPSKLNQLVRKNQKLREKFSVAKIHRKVTENDAAEQFINKLEEETEVGQELWTRVCALTCFKSHKILMETLNSLHLEQIEDSSPQYTMYRAKRTLEFVLSVFAELQNEADFFCKANFKNTSNSNHNVKQNHDLDVPWLDTGQQALGRNYALQCYLNVDNQWTDLKFIEHYLQVQILMTELVLTEWSQALKSNKLDQNSVQALYGLMTASGQCLPAFVINEGSKC
ncbi:hypothetical protein BgiBS90_001861 [Biomphalaria glabrata]|nr:hypothetical protein BgiBS90_001861 [Biomphalaria glabrata]